jgi:GTPase SAR1 family protein
MAGKAESDLDLGFKGLEDRSLSSVILKAKHKMQGNHENGSNGVTYLVIGSSGSGKSTLIQKIFLEKIYTNPAPDGKKWLIVLFTGSEQSDALEKCFKLKNVVVAPGHAPDEDIISWMYSMNQTYGKEKYNFVNIFDDVIHVRYNKVMERCFLTYRNSNISSIMCIQHANHIPKSIRGSAYFVFVLPMNNSESTELAVQQYLKMYLPGKTVREKVRSCREWCNNYQFYFLDNLNHICYKVTNDYNVTRVEEFGDEIVASTHNLKRKRRKLDTSDNDYDYESNLEEDGMSQS